MLRPTGWQLVVAPVDLRCGTDRLLVMVQTLAGNAAPGAAYVFRNRSGTRIKLLFADATGVWLCTRRLDAGRFVWPREGDTMFSVTPRQFEWLCAGIDWQRLSASKPLAGIV